MILQGADEPLLIKYQGLRPVHHGMVAQQDHCHSQYHCLSWIFPYSSGCGRSNIVCSISGWQNVGHCRLVALDLSKPHI